MRLKTYKAHDLETALARARQELGADALVLATNELPGRLGLSSVEITVGVDRPDRRLDGSLSHLLRDVGKSEETIPDPVAQGDRDVRRAEPAMHPALTAAVESLVRAGLPRDLATRFARIASRDLPPQADPRRLVSATEKGIEGLVGFCADPLPAPVMFVVGPPGAGKTTAVARLAARSARQQRRKVVLAAADRRRVGAREQAAGFARLVGAELSSIQRPADLCRLVRSAGGTATVLVDTCGVAAGDHDRLEELVALRRAAGQAEVAVLIPAGSHDDQARRVVERFQVLEPTSVAFSKIDDGGRLGELVGAISPSGLPLSFVTTGHRVGDLEPATARGLAALLLRSGFAECTREGSEA